MFKIGVVFISLLLFLFPFQRGNADVRNQHLIRDSEFVDPLIDSPLRTIGSDFNGDGIHDVIVGAPLNDEAATSAGAAYIFFGSTTLSGTTNLGGGESPDVTFLGQGTTTDQLGKSVAGVGDLNGDGIDDIILGAPYNDETGTNRGAAYIFFGASDLSGTKNLSGGQAADITILGASNAENMGFSVSGAGDVNGDGFDDILVGAYGNDDYGANRGAAYIFFGAGDLSGKKDLSALESADFSIIGKVNSDQLGVSVSGTGDVNGDGFDDIVVGAYGNDDAANNAGAAYIFFGSSTLSGTKNLDGVASPDVTVLGKGDTDFLGKSVSEAGDVNRDGFDDILVGAYSNADLGTNRGAAYVFFGASALSGTKNLGGGQSADVTVLGAANSDVLGLGISGAGDINDDGKEDIIIGAYNNESAGGTNRGSIYIFFGSSTLSGTKNLETDSADFTAYGKQNSDRFGKSVSGLGDVNDDGIPDFFVGAEENNEGGGTDRGAAYIFFGSTTISGSKDLAGVASPDATFLGKVNSDKLGSSVGGGRSSRGP